MFDRGKILAHRGYWKTDHEKNTRDAFERALSMGFGVETDIRDQQGGLVVEHDLPISTSLSIGAFFELYNDLDSRAELALNMKSDGLATHLKEHISKHKICRYFCFDMSIPDTLQYRDGSLKFYSRHSELEPTIAFEHERAGIWFDAFGANNVDIERAVAQLKLGEKCCLVSPELHRRPYKTVWDVWKKGLQLIEPRYIKRLSICTDLPEQAEAFFKD